MLELIFGLIGAVLYGAWWLLTKTWPLLLGGFILFMTFGLGGLLMDSISEAPVQDKMEDFSHIVTIYWDEEGNSSETYYVREDLNWALDANSLSNRKNTSSSLYHVKNFDSITLPDAVRFSDREFLGLFTSPYGLEQYVDRNGYSLRNVKSDITLYALWAPAE